VLEFMASSIKGDIRTLEGALVNLLAISSLKREDIDLSLAKLVLEKHVGQKKINQIDVQNIIKIVCSVMKVKEKEVLGKSRSMEIALARQVCMFMAKEKTNLSLVNIGKHIGKRDHSTVIHAHKNITQKLNTDVELKQIIQNIDNQI